MFKKTTPNKLNVHDWINQFPHCDQRILHAPGECDYCDKHPKWQALRQAWGIAFTGYEPEGTELPDPATNARGATSINAWQGNVAAKTKTTKVGNVSVAIKEEYEMPKHPDDL